MFLTNGKKIDQLLRHHNLEKNIKIQVTEFNSYVLDLNEVLTFVFENNLGRIYNEKHYEKMMEKDSLFLRLCGSFILNDLRENKERTKQIYIEYLKESNMNLFFEHDIGYLACIELFYVILSQLYKTNELFKLPLSAIHMSLSNQENYIHPESDLKDLNIFGIKHPEQFKKEWVFHRIEEVVNENLDLLDVDSLSSFLSNEGMKEGDEFSLYQAPFKSFSTASSLIENIDLFLNEHKEFNNLIPDKLKNLLMFRVNVVSGLDVSDIRKEKRFVENTDKNESVYNYLDFEFYDVVGLVVFFEKKLFNHVSYSNYKIDDFK